jgi:hypothetical protein
MRLGSRNKRRGSAKSSDVSEAPGKHPKVEPFFLEKAAHLLWADKIPKCRS